jgi:hypothetical protein
MASGWYDFVAGAKPLATEWDDYISKQVVMTFTTETARDTALTSVLRDGMFAYTTTTPVDTLKVYNGSAWEIVSEPMQAWNITSVTQSGSVTCTTVFAWYRRERNQVTGQFTLSVTGAGTASNAIVLPTPVTLTNAECLGGSYVFFDQSTGLNYSGALVPATTTTFTMGVNGSGVSLGGAGFTGALANTDFIRCTLTGRY